MATSSSASEDLSALSWVAGELQRSLDAAHKSLRRYLKEAQSIGSSDVDVPDTTILRAARVQFHQGVGALELVGLTIPAKVLRASEAAVQRIASKPALADAAAVETIESASFAVLDYLHRVLARRDVSGVALFPQYRAVLMLAGGDRVHPADLWGKSWRWQELPGEPGVAPRAADDDARGALESLVLALMRRTDAESMSRMSDFCAELGAGARTTLAATTWRLAAAFFDAQAGGLLDADLYAKRMASRLLAQLRANMRSDDDVSERLASDLLFFCARARAPQPGQAPRLQAVRDAWQLGDTAATTDYETSRLGRFDPAWIAQARRRVVGAKDVWSAVAGGDTRRLPGLAEPFALLGDSLQRLFPGGDVLAHALQAAAAQTTVSGEAPAPALAMEMATAVLWLDAALEDGEFDAPELAARMRQVAQRVDMAREGGEVQPLQPWIEELYRRVSDHQTMGSVVHELRVSLTEIEKQIDQYFRDPQQREVLVPVPAQLSAMRGVLSVLDLEQASQAVLHMSNAVDELASTEVDPERAAQTGVFNRLADNLGALGFLIDMLSVQPHLARTLFHFDAEHGRLVAAVGTTARPSSFGVLGVDASEPLVDQAQTLAHAAVQPEVSDEDLSRQLEELSHRAVAADQAALARVAAQAQQALDNAADDDAKLAARAEWAQAVNDLVVPATPAEWPRPAPHSRPDIPPSATGETGLEDDAEMRGIFIEEAREVIASARQSLQRLAANSEDLSDITVVRRAFHTLKGSSRMVGLRSFGDAAWACEQLYNARLADDPRVDPPLHDFTRKSLDVMSDWIQAIQSHSAERFSAAPIEQAAQALRVPGVAVSAPAALVDMVPELPSATDLDLPSLPVAQTGEIEAAAPVESAEPAEQAERAEPVLASGEATELDFALDLGALEAEPVVAAVEAATPAFEMPPLAEVEELDFSSLDEFSAAGQMPAAVPADEPALQFAHEFAAESPIQPHEAQALPEPTPEPEPAPPSEDWLDLAAQSLEPLAPQPLEPPLAELPLPLVDALPAAEVEPAPVALPESLVAEPLEFAALDEGGSATHDELAIAEPAGLEAEPPEPLERADEEQVKIIGPLRIGIPLFNIFLNEADEQSRRLVTELAEWSLEHRSRPVSEAAIALAHSLAGNSATVGFADLSALARALEHALMRSQAHGLGRDGEAELFSDCAEEIRRLLHQFAAGFLKPVPAVLMTRLSEHESWPSVERVVSDAEPPAQALAELDDLDAVDDVDAELLPIFREEADELLPQLQMRMRDWVANPDDRSAAQACMRALHTFKGGARLAGAMRVGELAHRLETAVETLLAGDALGRHQIEPLQSQADHLVASFEAMRHPRLAQGLLSEAPAVAEAASALSEPEAEPRVEPEAAAAEPAPEAVPPAEPLLPDHAHEAAEDHEPSPPAPAPMREAPAVIDWSRFSTGAASMQAAVPAAGPATGVVRVRTVLLDRLVNGAGEVSIARARIESDVAQLQSSLGDLTDSLDRMRRELRDIEVQAETQISSRIDAAKASAQAFDPLEMDRFTRLQELTRMMAESVNDVATLQRGLQRTLQSAEDQLAAQTRLTREMQDDLLRTRMIDFESLADRLYRVVRQASRDTGKQVRLDIVGGSIEVDRGVLDRMIGPFEHLLRNAVAHGIELPGLRTAAGKDASGTITINVAHVGNEVAVEFADDGAGLDLQRIREHAVERGLLEPEAPVSDADLAQLIFVPGFSTAMTVTELAGRGFGMDVVRAEVNAMGGRIEIASRPGLGTSFRLVLPLTTAVTQVVLLRCGSAQTAVPSTLVEVVRRVPTSEVVQAYESGQLLHAGEAVPFFWLASLIEGEGPMAVEGRTQAVVVVRSASQRVALHVDEVLGNQEVVVKHLGPQLAHMPALAGVTLLPSGAVALIYNPVALMALYGEQLRSRRQQGLPAVGDDMPRPVPLAPLVMVVDDSLTVRRVTQRLLEREGYRVVLAKDGVDALERLAHEKPLVMLCDIEMPRMDGFELVRTLRADPLRPPTPVIMITSRIAQKHRDHAAQLGVEHYLGKPFSEDALLSLVALYTRDEVVT